MSGVSQWLGELDPREQTILRSRYGLSDDPGKVTLQSLADQLGLSRERIRQLEIRAIEKLRAAMAESELCRWSLARAVRLKSGQPSAAGSALGPAATGVIRVSQFR